MKVFDTFYEQTEEILNSYNVMPLPRVEAWPTKESNPFLMSKDTAFELGGYPKESVNLLIASKKDVFDGCKIIGDSSSLRGENHISFGKIVLLQTKTVPDENAYDFTQKMLITDSKLRFDDIMLRTSSRHYLTNYKIGKAALSKGFSFEIMANSIRNSFLKLPEVEKVLVILIVGESNIYKELLPIAETVKETTVALNHIFDGIEMDCGKCDFAEICSEIDGLKEMHQKQREAFVR